MKDAVTHKTEVRRNSWSCRRRVRAAYALVCLGAGAELRAAVLFPDDVFPPGVEV